MPRFSYSAKHGDLIGAHLSTKGGLHTVFDRAAEIDASAVALFAKNSNQWRQGADRRRREALRAKADGETGLHPRFLSDQSRDDES